MFIKYRLNFSYWVILEVPPVSSAQFSRTLRAYFDVGSRHQALSLEYTTNPYPTSIGRYRTLAEHMRLKHSGHIQPASDETAFIPYSYLNGCLSGRALNLA